MTSNPGTTKFQIKDKLLNYCSDISSIIDNANFKALASGEPIEAKKLYKNEVTIINYARLAFNTNELPYTKDFSEAFFRRFLIIKFDETIPEEKRDPKLDKRIIEGELPGVMNWVMAGFKRLVNNQGFSKCNACEEELKRYQKESDSVACFIDKYYEKSNEYLMQSKLFSEYKEYCAQHNYTAVSDRKFGKRIIALGYKQDRKSGGNIIFCQEKKYESQYSDEELPF